MPPPLPAVPVRARLRVPSASDMLLTLVSSLTLVLSLQHSDDAVCAVINVGLFVLPLLLVALLSGRLRLAAAFASALGLLLWGVGETKMQFFGERLGLMDFYFLSGTGNWSIVTRYPEMQRALGAWLLLVTVLAFFAIRGERMRPALGARARVLAAASLLGWCAFTWTARHHHAWEVFREDADCGEQKVCGVLSRLVYSYVAFEFIAPRPAGDSTRFLEAASQLRVRSAPRRATLAGTAAGSPARLPDVVVWLHESTFDPAGYALGAATLPKLAMFERAPTTLAAGQLRVHTYGGRTWLSEFSLLTGLVPADFGARSNLVFNSVAPNVSSTLVHRFEAAGYDTVVLMPTAPDFYGAGRTYTQIGFDRVLTLRDFPAYDHLPGGEWEISDSPRLAEVAVQLLREQRARPDPRPLFIYMLSIREHGPYEADTRVAYGLERAGLTESLAARLTDYVDRLRVLDGAMVELERELSNASRPALWAYFGDHQAYFGETQPAYRSALTDPDMVTQYQLRANYDLPALDSPALLDIALLPSLIVDSAGVPSDAYFDAQSAMRQLCDGRLRDCAVDGLVDSYKGYVFDDALGLFAPPPKLAPHAAR